MASSARPLSTDDDEINDYVDLIPDHTDQGHRTLRQLGHSAE